MKQEKKKMVHNHFPPLQHLFTDGCIKVLKDQRPLPSYMVFYGVVFFTTFVKNNKTPNKHECI